MHSLRLEPRREWELGLPVSNAYLPVAATVLLKQHAGDAARCVVKEGDVVREGMVLGVPDGEGSTYIHSPIPGTIRSISSTRLPGGAECATVEIILHGSFDRLGKRAERYVWRGMRRSDILQTLRSKGVVETGGRGEPLDRLLEAASAGCELEVPAMDFEPYLRTETAVFASRSAELVEAAKIVASVMQAGRITILVDALEIPAHQARVEGMSGAGETPLEFLSLRSSRAGMAAAREASRSGAESRRLSILPSTLAAVYDAVVESKAFVERYVTVAGGAVRNPAVLKARIGTPIGDLIEECGGFAEPPERLVLGGPLTGVPARDLDMPVTKTLGAVLALTPPETRKGKVRPCIRCGRCREHCPAGIDPEIIHRELRGGRLAEARAKGLESCLSCGLCSYVCPSRIELSQDFAAHAGGIR